MEKITNFYNRYWIVIAILLMIVIPIIMTIIKLPNKVIFVCLITGAIQFFSTIIYSQITRK